MKLGNGLAKAIFRRGAFLTAFLVLATARLASADVSGEAATWGFNGDGELGNGTTVDGLVPAAISGVTTGVTAVSESESAFGLALQGGAVFAWGFNLAGNLGNGTNTNSTLPVPVSNLGSGVTAISAGGGFGLAIQNGGVYAWGYNKDGELGNGSNINSNVPVAVSGLGSPVTAVAGGGGHGLALVSGAVYAWGSNENGQLGNHTTVGSNVPVAVTGLPVTVIAIAAGSAHSLAIQNGGVYAWGQGAAGQLGDGSFSDASVPTAVSGLTSGVTAVAAGQFTSLAVKGGAVYVWGDNSNGQLANGSFANSDVPVLVSGLPNNIVAVAAGSYSCYALTSDGQLWDWGDNLNGELGLGTSGNSYFTPQHVPVPDGYQFAAIDGGEFSAVGILVPVPEPASLAVIGMCATLLLRRTSRSANMRG